MASGIRKDGRLSLVSIIKRSGSLVYSDSSGNQEKVTGWRRV